MNVESNGIEENNDQEVIPNVIQTKLEYEGTCSSSDDYSNSNSTPSKKDTNNGLPPVIPHGNDQDHHHQQSPHKGTAVIIQQRYGASAYNGLISTRNFIQF